MTNDPVLLCVPRLSLWLSSFVLSLLAYRVLIVLRQLYPARLSDALCLLPRVPFFRHNMPPTFIAMGKP
eukprot:8871938-Pyramimonas_sp.AAC.3